MKSWPVQNYYNTPTPTHHHHWILYFGKHGVDLVWWWLAGQVNGSNGWLMMALSAETVDPY